jgi:hypothetical protein
VLLRVQTVLHLQRQDRAKQGQKQPGHIGEACSAGAHSANERLISAEAEFLNLTREPEAHRATKAC